MAGEIQVKFAWSGRARSLRTTRAVTAVEQPGRIYSETVKPDESEPQPRDPKALHQRNIRISDEVWDSARERVGDSKPRRVTVVLDGDETVSEAVRKFLERLSR